MTKGSGKLRVSRGSIRLFKGFVLFPNSGSLKVGFYGSLPCGDCIEAALGFDRGADFHLDLPEEMESASNVAFCLTRSKSMGAVPDGGKRSVDEPLGKGPGIQS